MLSVQSQDDSPAPESDDLWVEVPGAGESGAVDVFGLDELLDIVHEDIFGPPD